MSREYIIEKHTHGWLICAPIGKRGVPMNTMNDCQMLCGKGTVIDAGIAHHYNAMCSQTPAVFAITTQEGSKMWRSDISEDIKNMDPEDRWWYGTDVGTSSAAIFAVLCHSQGLAYVATQYGNGSTPRDAADLGRCLRLLEAIPEWNTRLNEVATGYPDTAWPAIIARWDELKTSTYKRQNEILTEIYRS